MKNKKQCNEIKQNEIESDNVGENAGGIAMDADENVEDTTKYGEFISSYFAWLTPERQKKRAKEIDDMTKQQKNVDIKLKMLYNDYSAWITSQINL